MIKLSLRNKLLVYSIILALLPLGIAGGRLIRITRDELKSSANDVISTTAMQLSQKIDALYTDTWMAPLHLVVSGVDNPELEAEQKLAFIQAGIQNILDVVACQISIAELSNPLLITKDAFTERLAQTGLEPRNVLLADPEVLERYLANARSDIVLGEIEHIGESDDWLVPIIMPLQTPIAERQAVFSVQINLNRLHRLISEHPFNRTGEITLVDRTGRRLFDPQRTDLSRRQNVGEAMALVATPSRAVSVQQYERPDGTRMLAGFSIPQHFQLALIVERRADDAYLAIDKMISTLTTVILVVVSGAILVGIFLALRISRPVEEIAAAAQAVGSGDLDVQITPPRSKDEIAVLAERMNEMISGLRDRDYIRSTFGQYLSDEVVQSILDSPEGAQLGGQKCTVTIMMTDLRGFTTIGERLPAEDVVGIINIYLETMTEIILKYHGTIDEFIGDAIFVIFGAPIERQDDAQRAVACGIEMQLAMAEVNRRCRERGFPEVQQGIGINTGEIVVGNIGSAKRMKYGCVGRNVNLTARIESYTVGGQTMLSDSTVNACGDLLRIDDQMEVMPKGVKKPITIYEVGGIGGDFNVFLPEKRSPELIALPKPLEVAFTVLAGKHAGEKVYQGKIGRLSESAAGLETDLILEKLVNLKISLFDHHGVMVSEDLYAKVTQSGEKPIMPVIVFTAVPPQAERFLLEQRQAAADSV